jgi:hypothetical protein
MADMQRLEPMLFNHQKPNAEGEVGFRCLASTDRRSHNHLDRLVTKLGAKCRLSGRSAVIDRWESYR